MEHITNSDATQLAAELVDIAATNASETRNVLRTPKDGGTGQAPEQPEGPHVFYRSATE